MASDQVLVTLLSGSASASPVASTPASAPLPPSAGGGGGGGLRVGALRNQATIVPQAETKISLKHFLRSPVKGDAEKGNLA